MAQPQNNVTVSAPGFAGLNTQDSPLDMAPQYASVANNCTIDSLGRVANRRGFQFMTTNPGTGVLDGNPIRTMGEFVKEDTGATILFAAGNNKIFIQQTGTPFELVEQTLPITPTADNWQMAQLNDKFFFVQSLHEPLYYDSSDGTIKTVTLSNPSSDGYPNCVHAAFGRLWVSDFDNNSTVFAWSSLLDGTVWNTHGAGLLQSSEYWPSGFDSVVAITAHNNFLVLFGQNNILIYTTTSDVLNDLQLSDTIEGLGCIGRDTIQSTGTDLLFIDSTGVRSLMRTVQEKSIPIGDISMNVRDEFQTALALEDTSDIKGIFHNEDNFYSCFLPTNPKTYVFDTWKPLESGAARATVWSDIAITCGLRTRNRTTYFAGLGGVYLYQGNSDVHLDGTSAPYAVIESPIRMEYYTHPLDFGSGANLIFPKQVDVTLIGGTLGTLMCSWGYDYQNPTARGIEKPISNDIAGNTWGGNLPPDGTGAEWSGGGSATDVVLTFDGQASVLTFDGTGNILLPNTADGVLGYWTESTAVSQLKYNIWGSGRNITVGFTSKILGSKVSIQELNIQVLQGRIL